MDETLEERARQAVEHKLAQNLITVSTLVAEENSEEILQDSSHAK